MCFVKYMNICLNLKLCKDTVDVSQLHQCIRKLSFVGDLHGIAGLHNMVGIGAGSILLPPVQASALGMPLLQGPDGAINIINNIQVGTTLYTVSLYN